MRGTLTANYKKDRLYQCRCYEITTRCNWTTKVFTAGYAIVFPWSRYTSNWGAWYG